ncbi:MAG: nitronate monooxygenase [Deltaproteobacteria bacterium]|nr:nitronate monooxygenase [Deltaproteobacteria bacterium]
MNTRITELLGIQYPIVQGGMVWNSGAKLAAAVSETGGLGLIGAGSMDPATLRYHIQQARRLTRRPFGVNLPLLYRHADENLKVIIEERVPIVFTSAGNPKRTTPLLKDAGTTVFHVTATPQLAQKCEQAGVDGVVAEGFEAGGHNGRDELTTLVLVPAVISAVSIPVLAAGGIATGAQMAAALALGADGVQVGTRFAATQEASGHESFKQALVQAKVVDSFLTIKKGVPVRLLDNRFRRMVMEAEASGAPRTDIMEMLGSGRERLGMFEGDLDNGELEAGQVVGLIDDIPPVRDVMHAFVAGFRQAVARLNGQLESAEKSGKK